MREVIYAARHLQPTHVVQIGDCFDFYNFSRFPTSLEVCKPSDELESGKSMANHMWREIQKACEAKCFQAWGNHEERATKMIMRQAPALEALLKIKDPLTYLMTFPGVQTLHSPLDELQINDVLFHHGWSCRPGYHVQHFLKNVVHGHTHHGGVVYLRAGRETLFELDCGVLADFNARPMVYRNSATSKWTTGFGWVDSWGPRFCPL